MADGKEWGSQAIGISTERRACQAHDTKRSDWHGTGRPKPGRANKNNLSITRSIKQKNSLSQPTDYLIEPKFLNVHLSAVFTVAFNV
jgi:hypothetical protein